MCVFEAVFCVLHAYTEYMPRNSPMSPSNSTSVRVSSLRELLIVKGDFEFLFLNFSIITFDTCIVSLGFLRLLSLIFFPCLEEMFFSLQYL